MKKFFPLVILISITLFMEFIQVIKKNRKTLDLINQQEKKII